MLGAAVLKFYGGRERSLTFWQVSAVWAQLATMHKRDGSLISHLPQRPPSANEYTHLASLHSMPSCQEHPCCFCSEPAAHIETSVPALHKLAHPVPLPAAPSEMIHCTAVAADRAAGHVVEHCEQPAAGGRPGPSRCVGRHDCCGPPSSGAGYWGRSPALVRGRDCRRVSLAAPCEPVFVGALPLLTVPHLLLPHCCHLAQYGACL